MLLLSFGVVVLITLTGANIVMAQEEGLILHLPFDEGSGDTVADLSATGLDGTVHGDAEWVKGINGGAINFDGGSAFVNLPASDVLHEAKEQVSFALWFNATVVPGDVKWIHMGLLIGRGHNGDFSLVLFNGCIKGWLAFEVGGLEFPKGAQAGECVPELDVEADRWYHVVVTYEAPFGKLYLDGELAVKNESKGVAIRYLDDDWTQFGAFRGQQQFFNGVIDEIRIYNRALTPEEIAQLWSISFAVASRGKLTTTWGKIKEH
jgi:hypothetical protein